MIPRRALRRYADAFVLMDELQRMGEANAATGRRDRVGRDTLVAAAAAYHALYSEPPPDAPDADAAAQLAARVVPATFQVIYMIGWAPHEQQQQPDRRGSASKSMRDLGASGGDS